MGIRVEGLQKCAAASVSGREKFARICSSETCSVLVCSQGVRAAELLFLCRTARLADYSRVDLRGVWYESVNFRAGKSTVSRSW